MLVLTRKVSEEIVLTSDTGELITLTLVSLKGSTARIGIAAPQRWKILRDELILRPPRPEETFPGILDELRRADRDCEC